MNLKCRSRRRKCLVFTVCVIKISIIKHPVWIFKDSRKPWSTFSVTLVCICSVSWAEPCISHFRMDLFLCKVMRVTWEYVLPKLQLFRQSPKEKTSTPPHSAAGCFLASHSRSLGAHWTFRWQWPTSFLFLDHYLCMCESTKSAKNPGDTLVAAPFHSHIRGDEWKKNLVIPHEKMTNCLKAFKYLVWSNCR